MARMIACQFRFVQTVVIPPVFSALRNFVVLSESRVKHHLFSIAKRKTAQSWQHLQGAWV
jgi:hypothetical protein